MIGHFGAFSTMSLRTKLLAVLVVFSFFINGFVPRFSIDVNECVAVSNVLASQSTLLQVISFSALPLKIVNDMFSEKSVPSPEKSAHSGKDDPRNTSNTSVDYSILSCGTNANASRLAGDLQGRDILLKAVCGISLALARSPALAEGIPPGERYVFLILVLFFFLLPRSSVGDGPAYNLYVKIPSAQLAQASWVFYLGGTL